MDHEPIAVHLTVHDGEDPGDARLLLRLFVVSNTPFIGGGHLVAPGAVVDDGALEVCLVEERPRWNSSGCWRGSPPADTWMIRACGRSGPRTSRSRSTARGS